ncbi:hypothetical protein [Enterococcus faecium]|uniref:hypothetical protein n=1 Tax=Enterococcus faecium TaxID=1352 RepID=UPI000957A3CF|nr:hypothetical protein [Enterococcus faecium]AOM18548.1 hypothetical protein AL015_04275 [Enterococcus faecium]MCC9086164.1 hypothetical protein [Enterococcus faecium]
MYIFETKIFHCNNCNKEISSGKRFGQKWKFPPKVTAPQLKSIKELEFENALVICMTCTDEVFRKHF